jgi:hypothetical protein
MSVAQSHVYNCDIPRNICNIAVLPVLEAALQPADSKYRVGNLLLLLVVEAKEQVRVPTESKFRRCQSIKWTVNRKASPAEPASQLSLPFFAILIVP